MQLVLELKHLSDLEVLLPLLKRLDILIVQTPKQAVCPEKSSEPVTLSKHIGVLPNIDVDAFEQYLDKTRGEWNRPIL